MEKRFNFVDMNGKNSILLVDPEFDPNTAADCQLLIRLGPDSFSYAIIDRNCNQLKAVYDQQECEDAAANLEAAIRNDSYLKLPFESVKVAVYTENTIAVPQELLATMEPASFSGYFNTAQTEVLYSHAETSQNFSIVYNFNKKIEETLQLLPGSRKFEQTAPLLALATEQAPESLYLDFTPGSFHLGYLRGGKLVFNRYFEIENAEEFNYYLLLAIQQLEIDTMLTAVYLSGIVHEEDPIYQCIARSFSQVHFKKAEIEHIDCRLLEDMPAHYYSGLLAIALCG